MRCEECHSPFLETGVPMSVASSSTADRKEGCSPNPYPGVSPGLGLASSVDSMSTWSACVATGLRPQRER